MKSNRARVLGASLSAMLLAGLGASCVPEPPAPTAPPVITDFQAITPSGAAPLTTALAWTVSDPGGFPLTCELDLDSDGTHDLSVADCTSDSLRTATFDAVGVNTVGLSVTNGTLSASATTEVTVAAGGPDSFDLTVRVDPSFDPAVASIADAAASRWEAVVVGGLADEAVSIPAGSLFTSTPGLDATIDDVFVDVVLEPVDGPGGGLALGGAATFRADGTSLWGAVAVDSDDYADLLADPAKFLDVLTHEIGHVMFPWPAFGALVDDSDPFDPRFTGQAAAGAFQELGGSGNVPMDGTSHWRTSVFGSELMTSAFLPGVPSKLSAVTAAALADVGYGVDLAGAEPYSLP